jgi:uncharacterized protein YkwD
MMRTPGEALICRAVGSIGVQCGHVPARSGTCGSLQPAWLSGDHRRVTYPSPVARILRLMAALLIGGLVLGANLPATTRAADGPTSAQLRAAEVRALKLINGERAKQHLGAIRMDARIRVVAQARSKDMVDRHYFDHQDPDGKWPWDHLNDAHIAYYEAGEIIAWNMTSPIGAATDTAISQWMHSPGHRDQILSTQHNYAGVGVAMDGVRSIWTVVFIQGPDRTDPKADLTKASSTTGSRAIHLTWSGSDPRLATLTAGLRSYDVVRRRPGGTWSTIRSDTTGTALTMRSSKGARYDFRVRARDAAGNVGVWSKIRSATVH